MEKFEIPSNPILAATVEKFNELIDLMEQPNKPHYAQVKSVSTKVANLIAFIPNVLECLDQTDDLGQVDITKIRELSKAAAAFLNSYSYEEVNRSAEDDYINKLEKLGMTKASIEARVRKIISQGMHIRVDLPEIRDDETEVESKWKNIEHARKSGVFDT
jgi:ribulose bisphosphate carboxylase small subunit